jgi:hypothetical protein
MQGKSPPSGHCPRFGEENGPRPRYPLMGPVALDAGLPIGSKNRRKNGGEKEMKS